MRGSNSQFHSEPSGRHSTFTDGDGAPVDNPHLLAVIAADVEAIGAPAPITLAHRDPAVMRPLDTASVAIGDRNRRTLRAKIYINQSQPAVRRMGKFFPDRAQLCLACLGVQLALVAACRVSRQASPCS